MTQNKKKGIAKKALSVSLVAAMLATSNVPAWASGFEAVDPAEGFAVEAAAPEGTELLGANTMIGVTCNVTLSQNNGSITAEGTITKTAGGDLLQWSYEWINTETGETLATGEITDGNVSKMTYQTTESDIGKTIALKLIRDGAGIDLEYTTDTITVAPDSTASNITNMVWEGSEKAGAAEYTYDGNEHKPALQSVMYKGITYNANTPNCEITSTYPGDCVNVTDSGEVISSSIVLKNKDGVTVFNGTVETPLTIKAANLSAYAIEISKDFTYDKTGNYTVTKDDITITDSNNKKLVLNTDYEVAVAVSGENKAGSSNLVITVTGKGNYTGSVILRKDIKAVDISAWTVSVDDQTWTGNPIEPSVITIKDEFNQPVSGLTKGTDYTVSYSNNTEVGDSAVVTVTGINNYTGTISGTFTIKALPADWSDLITAINNDLNATKAAGELEYTGNPIDWVDNVYGNGKYVKGRDFTCTYAPQNTNATTGNSITLIVKGIGTYASMQDETIKFDISAKSLADTDVKASIPDIAYQPTLEAEDFEDALVVTYNGMTLQENLDYKFTTNSSKFNGETYTATIEGIGNYAGTKNITKKVTKKAIDSVELPKIDNQVYTGAAIVASGATIKDSNDALKIGDDKYQIKDGDKVLILGTDYVITRQYNNTNVGLATIEIAGRGSYTGTATINFLIVAEELTGTIVDSTSKSTLLDDVEYSYQAASSTKGIEYKNLMVMDKDGKQISNATITYENNHAVGTVTVTATIESNNQILTVAQNTFRIVPALLPNMTISGIDSNGYTYTGEAVEPEVSVSAKDYSYTLVEGVDYEITYVNNVNANKTSVGGTISGVEQPAVVVVGKGNYAGLNSDGVVNFKSQVFDIKKALITNANIVAKDVAYAGGIAVTPDITITNPATGKALVEDTDYTLKAATGSDAVNVGITKYTITLKDEAAKNYDLGRANGKTFDVTFKITKKALSDCDVIVSGGKITVQNGSVTVPESEYTITENEDGTYTVAAKADGNYTGSVTVDGVNAPAATTLSVTNRTTSTVTLSWDAVEDAEGYTIWFRSEYEDSVSRKIINGGDVTSWTQTGLQPGTKYFYTVRAWIDNGTPDAHDYIFSEQSPVQRGTTKPLAATIIGVTVTDGKIKVRLAGEAEGAEMYSMCYGDSRACFKENDFKVGIRTQYTTRTLNKTFEPGTYYVCVKSYRDLGNNKRVYGEWSNTFRAVVK